MANSTPTLASVMKLQTSVLNLPMLCKELKGVIQGYISTVGKSSSSSFLVV